MENKERRTVEINGKEYTIVGVETDTKIVVDVFDGDKQGRSSDAVMVEHRHRKKGVLTIREKPHPELPEAMQRALSEAVNTVETKRSKREEIDSRLEDVKESYEK